MKSSFSILLVLLQLLLFLTHPNMQSTVADDYAQVQPEETCPVMTVLVVGATGATGRHVVQMLLEQGHVVKAIVRNETKLRSLIAATSAPMEHLLVTEASLLDLSDATLNELTRDCNAIVSCLGHTLNVQGIWGKPYWLVTEAVQRLLNTTIFTNNKNTHHPAKFLLMASNGVGIGTTGTSRTTFERGVLWLLRHLVPPHADNEQAVAYLQASTNSTTAVVEWAVIRPGVLVESNHVTGYSIHPTSPRGPFSDGSVSRINVAHLMVELVLKDDLWQEYKYQMPIILNKDNEELGTATTK